MAVIRILNVGSCDADNYRLEELLARHFSATVVNEATAGGAMSRMAAGGWDLVLVNRIFDEDGTCGLELIKSIKSDGQLAQLPVMLVSNYADSQEQAVSLGAERGFGKAELAETATVSRLNDVLRQTQDNSARSS